MLNAGSMSPFLTTSSSPSSSFLINVPETGLVVSSSTNCFLDFTRFLSLLLRWWLELKLRLAGTSGTLLYMLLSKSFANPSNAFEWSFGSSKNIFPFSSTATSLEFINSLNTTESSFDSMSTISSEFSLSASRPDKSSVRLLSVRKNSLSPCLAGTFSASLSELVMSMKSFEFEFSHIFVSLWAFELLGKATSTEFWKYFLLSIEMVLENWLKLLQAFGSSTSKVFNSKLRIFVRFRGGDGVVGGVNTGRYLKSRGNSLNRLINRGGVWRIVRLFCDIG